MRPTILKKDNTLYWVLNTYDSDGVLVDADSTPTIAIRKNGASTADSVTITKRAATTGIYDCSYNPASEADGDIFTVEETATISSQAYVNAWGFTVVDPAQYQATGFSTHNAADVLTAFGTGTTLTACATITAAAIRTALGLASANVDAQLTAIVGDTNELQTDWADGGRLDLILDGANSGLSSDDITIIVNQIKGSFVSPYTNPNVSQSQTMRASTAEAVTHKVFTYNPDGTALDTTGLTLTFVIEGQNGTDIATVDNATITTRTSTYVEVPVPSAAHTAEQCGKWALRTSTGAVVAKGPYVIEYAASVDA